MSLTKEQTQEMKDRVDLARQNLVNFRYYLLTNGKDEVAPASYHYDWSDILLNEEGNFAIEGFRESAKGQIVLRAFPLYCLMFPSKDRDYIVLIKDNATLASDKLLEIETEYLTNPALSANLVEVKQKSAKVFSVDVKNSDGEVMNVRIETYGKGSAIRGLANIDRRPKVVVIDDPQSTEDSRSETVLKNDWEWFLSDVKFLGQITKIVLIGNNLGEKCIIERVFANAPELGFKTRKIAVMNKSGLPSWPEKFTQAFIEKERENYRKLGQLTVWMRERMCEAVTPENRIFNLLDIVRFSYLYLDKIVRNCNFFLTLDGASSKDPTACYRAITTVAVTEDNRWIVCDISYGRWKSDETINKIFEAVLKWIPYNGRHRRLPFGIEKGWFKQMLEPFIMKEMQARNIFFNIIPIEHAKEGNKLDRVKMLAPRVAGHTILMPENASWLPELENEMAGVTQDGFKSLFNDLIDSLSMQNQIAKPPMTAMIDRPGGELQEVKGYDALTGQYAGIQPKNPAGFHDPVKPWK